jgi:hypothetical protein
MTKLQQRIWDLLTDEPQTAAEIAEQIGTKTRVVANALVWMRSDWLAWDGNGFAVVEDGETVFEYPYAPWFRRNGVVRWVKQTSCPVFRLKSPLDRRDMA